MSNSRPWSPARAEPIQLFLVRIVKDYRCYFTQKGGSVLPKEGGREGLVFLSNPHAQFFQSRTALGRSFTDKNGKTWILEKGECDAETRNYGFFDGTTLIARVSVISPSLTSNDCPTNFWSVGRIEVADQFQSCGIGSGLLVAVIAEMGVPLASDVVQTEGGAAVWKRFVRDEPDSIEAHDPSGCLGTVNFRDGAYKPNPWARREIRLVRRP